MIAAAQGAIKEIAERTKVCCESLLDINSIWSFFDNRRFSTTRQRSD
jgi:hypothetical protein